MKKKLRVLATSLVFVLATSACGAKPAATTAPATSAPATAATTAPATSAPATSAPAAAATTAPAAGRVKLQIAIQASTFTTDYDMQKNYLSKYIADKNNVDLSFYMLPSESAELRTKVSLMVAAKDNMPDILNIDNSLSPEMILDYGSKGAFLPLNDYLNDPKLTPNFAAVAPADKEIMIKTMTMANGKMYAFPKYEPETWNLTPTRLYMNKTWLKKLNLEVPKTTEDLYNTLVAFRDKDPNGNGAKDEIGVYGYYAGGYGENVIAGLINSFTFFNNFGQNGGLALDASGKTVIAPYTTDEFREALRFLNKLYSEKLLAASLFTDDQQQYRAVLNNAINIVGITSAGSTGNWPDANKNANFAELTIIPPLTGPKGVSYTPYSNYVPGLTFFITSNCKNPEAAVKLGDDFLSRDTSDIARFGQKGLFGEKDADWSDAPADVAKTTNAYVEAKLYDKLRLVILSNMWAEPAAKNWHNINARYATLDMGNTVGNLYSPYDPSLPTTMLNAFNYEHYYTKHPEKVLPLLKYTVDEAQANSESITNVVDYVKQSIAEFTTGARNIDTGWDQYLKELDSIGLQDWLKSAQTAYER